MKILVVLPDRMVGGGQIAALRIAEALSRQHQVKMLYAIPEWADETPPEIPPGVELIRIRKGVLKRLVSGGLLHIAIATSRLTQFLRLNINHDRLVKGALKRVHRMAARSLLAQMEFLEIDLVHTHVWWSDAFIGECLKSNRTVPWVITMHGCYEGFLRDGALKAPLKRQIVQVLQRADRVVYLAEKNLQILDQLDGEITADKFRKIYTGIQPGNSGANEPPNRPVPDAELIFGIVSRAIPEKGWKQAIQAIELVRRKRDCDIHLMLAGDSAYRQELEADCRNYVRFYGNITNPMEWVRGLDIGLLPSYFASESLPTTVVEYLVAGKPVIATDLGEVRNMISTPDGPAGIILPDPGPEPVAVDKLADAILCYIDDPSLRERHAARAVEAAEKFSMDACVEQYLQVFAEAAAHRKAVV